MENSRRFLPERKNRGNRMSELAKDEGKMLEDDKYGIFKEDSSDDDFNPNDLKKEVNSSSDEENEEGEEGESNEEENQEESENISYKSPKKKNKNEEEILDIDQLDIDKIDMIEDLKDRGIDISDEEELEKRMREYNEEIEMEDEEEKEKEKEKIVEVVKKKRGRKSKKELEIMHKKRGRKKKIVEKDDNIFLPDQTTPTPMPEINDNKIIIENSYNNIELNEEEKEEKIQNGKSSKIKKSKKEKLKRELDLEQEQIFPNITRTMNQNIISEDNFIITLNKRFLTEKIPSILYMPLSAKLDYIELNNKNFDSTLSNNNKEIQKKNKTRLSQKIEEKTQKYINPGIIEINNNNIIINKKLRTRNNETTLEDEISNNNEIIGHKRTRRENNLIELFKKQKRDKPNKNVIIVGNRENPKYIYISKKIFDENDEEREIRKEEKKKKKKEKEKQEDEKNKENERLNFDLEQEMDTKNIIMKYKQQEKEKKQFGIQNKYISQEQRLFESIFTELTNKQSLKTMQKLEDLNKRENYMYTSRKAFKDYIKIINSERHILDDKKNDENKKEEEKIDIEAKDINKGKDNIIEENLVNENINKDEANEEKEKIEKINDENENKFNKNIIDQSKLEKEYREKEKKLNKVFVTFTNKEYFKIFNNLNKKITKDKKEKVCAITGKPAKYFDPLTKNYYSTIDAFKILRERYYQKEEDCLLFKIQTLSDLASQKKEKLKKMIMSENDKPKEHMDYIYNNNELPKNNNAIKIDSETMSIKENDENNRGNKYMGENSAILKMINKFGLLKNDGGDKEKKVISHRIYNRNRENCVESGMLLEANKVKLIISKKIFKDKYSSKLPAPEMNNE